jgi:Protein of unknown function (DUF2281)
VNEFLKKRIERKLDALPDERVYQVLDYIEFLESKYAARTPAGPSPLQRIAETVENTLRAGRVSTSAIRGTMDAMGAAGRVMSGLAAAGKAVVDEVTGGGSGAAAPAAPAAPAEAPRRAPEDGSGTA